MSNLDKANVGHQYSVYNSQTNDWLSLMGRLREHRTNGLRPTTPSIPSSPSQKRLKPRGLEGTNTKGYRVKEKVESSPSRIAAKVYVVEEVGEEEEEEEEREEDKERRTKHGPAAGRDGDESDTRRRVVRAVLTPRLGHWDAAAPLPTGGTSAGTARPRGDNTCPNNTTSPPRRPIGSFPSSSSCKKKHASTKRLAKGRRGANGEGTLDTDGVRWNSKTVFGERCRHPYDEWRDIISSTGNGLLRLRNGFSDGGKEQFGENAERSGLEVYGCSIRRNTSDVKLFTSGSGDNENKDDEDSSSSDVTAISRRQCLARPARVVAGNVDGHNGYDASDPSGTPCRGSHGEAGVQRGYVTSRTTDLVSHLAIHTTPASTADGHHRHLITVKSSISSSFRPGKSSRSSCFRCPHRRHDSTAHRPLGRALLLLITFVYITSTPTSAASRPSPFQLLSASLSTFRYQLLPPSHNESILIYFSPPSLISLRVNTKQSVYFNFTLYHNHAKQLGASGGGSSSSSSTTNNNNERKRRRDDNDSGEETSKHLQVDLTPNHSSLDSIPSTTASKTTTTTTTTATATTASTSSSSASLPLTSRLTNNNVSTTSNRSSTAQHLPSSFTTSPFLFPPQSEVDSSNITSATSTDESNANNQQNHHINNNNNNNNNNSDRTADVSATPTSNTPDAPRGYWVMIFSNDDNVARPVLNISPSGSDGVLDEDEQGSFLLMAVTAGKQHNFSVEARHLGRVTMSVAVVDGDGARRMPQASYVQAVAASQYSVTTVRGERTADLVFNSAAAAIAIIISFGIGACTDTNSLKRQLKYPVSLIIGFCCQFILMPVMAFGLAMLLPLDKDIRFGLLCVACVPGGGLSHVAVIIADGDIALSLTINLIAVVAMLGTAPLWIFVLGQYFQTEPEAVLNPRSIPIYNFEVWLAVTFFAYSAGLLIKKLRPAVADAILMWLIKPLLLLASILYITLGVYINMYVFELVNELALLSAALLPLCGCVLGAATAAICRQNYAFVKTIALETSSLNCLVVMVALRFSLQQPDADLAAMIPIWVMFTVPGLFVFLAICTKAKDTVVHYWRIRNNKDEQQSSIKAYSAGSSAVSPPGTTTLSAPLVVADAMDDDLTVSTMSNQKVTVL